MRTRDQIKLWLKWSDELLNEIRESGSGFSIQVTPGLALNSRPDPLVSVKVASFLVSLTAVLDYLAYRVVARYKLKPKGSKVYFPVECLTRKRFESAAGRYFPGLREIEPELYHLLEQAQPFSRGCLWLGLLKKQVNENKHLRLTAVKIRVTGLRFSRQGTVSRTRDPRHLPRGHGRSPTWRKPSSGNFMEGQVLIFEGTDLEVVPLLERCRKDVDKILSDVKRFRLP